MNRGIQRGEGLFFIWVCQPYLINITNNRQRTLERTVEFSFKLLQSDPYLPPFFFCPFHLGFWCTKTVHVCLSVCLCYGDLGKVSGRGINCRIPRTSKRRGADCKKRAREHCCFGSLIGFLSALFFSFFLINQEKEEKLTKGLQTFLFGCVDLQNNSG